MAGEDGRREGRVMDVTPGGGEENEYGVGSRMSRGGGPGVETVLRPVAL